MSNTPIADHAILSDRHSTALVDRSGSVEWLSFPRFHSRARQNACRHTEREGAGRAGPSISRYARADGQRLVQRETDAASTADALTILC
jgi:GH15 family glucan-1,4-alpha-glucosidase